MKERFDDVYVELTALPKLSMLPFDHGSTKLELVVPVRVQVVVATSRVSLKLKNWLPISAPTFVAVMIDVRPALFVIPFAKLTRRIGSVDPPWPITIAYPVVPELVRADELAPMMNAEP
jgi:hypothetical protein